MHDHRQLEYCTYLQHDVSTGMTFVYLFTTWHSSFCLPCWLNVFPVSWYVPCYLVHSRVRAGIRRVIARWGCGRTGSHPHSPLCAGRHSLTHSLSRVSPNQHISHTCPYHLSVHPPISPCTCCCTSPAHWTRSSNCHCGCVRE